MKGKSDDWRRYGLLDASVAKPFLPPFSPCATTLPRSGGEEAIVLYKATQTLAQFKLWKLKLRGSVQLQVHTYVAILRMPTGLRLIRAYLGCGYGRTTATGTGILRLWLRAYYSYGRTTTTATGVLRLRLRENVRAYYVNFFTAYFVHLQGSLTQPCTLCNHKIIGTFDLIPNKCTNVSMFVFIYAETCAWSLLYSHMCQYRIHNCCCFVSPASKNSLSLSSGYWSFMFPCLHYTWAPGDSNNHCTIFALWPVTISWEWCMYFLAWGQCVKEGVGTCPCAERLYRGGFADI